MRLCDAVGQASNVVAVSRAGEAWRLPGPAILATRLRECPLRYVLSDEVTALCTELAFASDTILTSAHDLLRVPAPGLWIEFRTGAREAVFADIGRLADKVKLAPRQVVGLYISSDEGGRRGRIDICWDEIDGSGPAIAAYQIEFDFDDPRFSAVENISCDGARIGFEIADYPSLRTLFSCTRLHLRPEWREFYANAARSEQHYRDILHDVVVPALEDMPFFALFCLLLTSRGALQRRPADLERLNRARTRRRRPELLDHIELTLDLGPSGCGTADEAQTVRRTGPRLHFVRGHLVRRGDRIHWRTSHMRGRPDVGAIRSRTVSLRLSSSATVADPAWGIVSAQ